MAKTVYGIHGRGICSSVICGPITGISVIVPTHNRQQTLRRCLQSLAVVKHDGLSIEVIVVNDGGAPLDVLDLQNLCPGIVLLEQAQTGPAGARNAGIAVASHGHLAFTDDDCVPDESWIVDLQQALACNPMALIGGQTVNLFPSNPYSEASQLVVNAFCRWQNRDPAGGGFIPSNNMACRRDQILALGGFNTTFPLAAGEDRDLCDRWRASGWPIVQLSQRAQVAHGHWLDHQGFWHQQLNYGSAAYTLHRLREARGVARRRAGAGFVGLLVRMAILRADGPLRRLQLLFLVLESQLAVLVGSLQQRYHERRVASQ